MKQKHAEGLWLIAMAFTCFTGCRKTTDSTEKTNDSTLTAPYPVLLQSCANPPSYGDSIVYTQPSVNSSDYYIYPQSNTGIPGSYLSWPQGLSLNSATGAIDLTTSQTGQRFSVGFVKAGSTDTCISQLIVGGVSYIDSVYNLSTSDTTSVPYFNANPFAPSPCTGNSGTGKGCQFDYNDYAKMQGIAVDKKTGYIDLVKTMKNIPKNYLLVNGDYLITTIYYKLNDNSNNAPQMIQLKLMYYNRKSDIPPALLAQVSQNLVNTLNNQILNNGPNSRPPLIIIVRNN